MDRSGSAGAHPDVPYHHGARWCSVATPEPAKNNFFRLPPFLRKYPFFLLDPLPATAILTFIHCQ